MLEKSTSATAGCDREALRAALPPDNRHAQELWELIGGQLSAAAVVYNLAALRTECGLSIKPHSPDRMAILNTRSSILI